MTHDPRRFDPCTPNPCGPNTECTVSGDRAICACNRGYTGDPNSRSTGCRADPCAVSDPCGRNAICENQASFSLGVIGGLSFENSAFLHCVAQGTQTFAMS